MELSARTTMTATLVHAILLFLILREAALKLLEGSPVTLKTERRHALVQVLVIILALNQAITVFA